MRRDQGIDNLLQVSQLSCQIHFAGVRGFRRFFDQLVTKGAAERALIAKPVRAAVISSLADDLRNSIAHELVVKLARHVVTVKRRRLRASAARSRKSTTTVVITRGSGALPARVNLAATSWRRASPSRLELV